MKSEKILKTSVIEERVSMNIKLTKYERAMIKERARKYTRKGNTSEWVRYAAMNYKPTPKELISQES